MIKLQCRTRTARVFYGGDLFLMTVGPTHAHISNGISRNFKRHDVELRRRSTCALAVRQTNNYNRRQSRKSRVVYERIISVRHGAKLFGKKKIRTIRTRCRKLNSRFISRTAGCSKRFENRPAGMFFDQHQTEACLTKPAELSDDRIRTATRR